MLRTLLLALLSTVPAGAASGQVAPPPTPEERASPPACAMAPARPVIRIPASGMSWLAGEELSGKCEAVPDSDWRRTPGRSLDLLVHADGPSGSGRFWTLTAGIATRGAARAPRGFCLQTSTIGWRTLQAFAGTPLPWGEDLDADGEPELVTWESFALNREGSPEAQALVGWVYRASAEGAWGIDWELTRRLAGELAAAYRAPLEGDDERLRELRGKASAALESLATGACSVPTPGPR